MAFNILQATAPPAPPPPLRAPSPRVKLLHGARLPPPRVPSTLDDFSHMVATEGSPGLDDFISKAIDEIAKQFSRTHRQQQHLHVLGVHQSNDHVLVDSQVDGQQKQLQRQQYHQLPSNQVFSAASSPQSINDAANKSPQRLQNSVLSPRRSPGRPQSNQLQPVVLKSALPANEATHEPTSAFCVFCEASQHDSETKLRRERSNVIAVNPITGNELSPGGTMPMRMPVATCNRCKGGVCESHLLIHSVKASGHWDSMMFHDPIVHASYFSLPSHTQLLSRVMLCIDTIRKRSALEKAEVSGYANLYSKSKDVYKRCPGWEGLSIHDFEISTFLARCGDAPVQRSRHEDSLSFESRFESGNLARAERIGPFEYKSKSLFQQGMRVLLRSPESSHWFRGGSDYIYKESTFFKKSAKTMFQLTFRLCTEYSSLYVAAAQPYTFSNLCSALDSWQNQQDRAIFMHRRTVCKSLAGNSVDLVTITDPDVMVDDSQMTSYPLKEHRPWIVIFGRVHPSECNATARLRRQFVWLLIPMMNPDGVICGNSRCNLAGLDLNRCWAQPSEITCPSIFSTKALLQRLCSVHTISLFLDVHGHSRKRGAFFYGNRRQQRSINGHIQSYSAATPGPEVKLPQIFAAHCPLFSLADCRYNISRSKMGTARYVVFNEFQLVNSFTLEISMFAAAASASLTTESASISVMPEPCNSFHSQSPVTFRDVLNNSKATSGVESITNPSTSLFQEHFEADDFMQLSRDFASCLIWSGLSWMHDSNGSVMKMSASSAVTPALHSEEFISSDKSISLLTTPQYSQSLHALQWLDLRGFKGVFDVAESNEATRCLFDCNSIKNIVCDVETEASSQLMLDGYCMHILKLFLGLARAYQALQGETPNTSKSVQSFLLHLLQTHVQRTDVIKLQATLRAIGDWAGFVIKHITHQQFNVNQTENKGALVDLISPATTFSGDLTSFPPGLRSLDALQRNVNRALEMIENENVIQKSRDRETFAAHSQSLYPDEGSGSHVVCSDSLSYHCSVSGENAAVPSETIAQRSSPSSRSSSISSSSLSAPRQVPDFLASSSHSSISGVRQGIRRADPVAIIASAPPLPALSSLPSSSSSILTSASPSSLSLNAPISTASVTGGSTTSSDSCVKPWSFSFAPQVISRSSSSQSLSNSLQSNQSISSSTYHSTFPSHTIQQKPHHIDLSSQIEAFDASPSVAVPILNRIRHKMMVRKCSANENGGGTVSALGRVDVVDSAKKDVGVVHVVSLTAPSFTSISNFATPQPPALSPHRRIRVAGALPFPISPSHSKQISIDQYSSRSIIQDPDNLKVKVPSDTAGIEVGAKAVEFSVFSGSGTGTGANLWSLPAVGGVVAVDADVRKSKVSGELLVLKKPPVTIVQPFKDERYPQHHGRTGPRPSTHR